MKYQIDGYNFMGGKHEVTNLIEVVFFDDDGKYLGKIRPWTFKKGEFTLDVIGNKNLKINVLSYNEAPIDSNWVSFGPRSSTPKVNENE